MIGTILGRSVFLSRLVAGRYDEVTWRKVLELRTRQTNPTKTITMMRTVVALTAATGIVAPPTVSLVGATSACIDSPGGGNVVIDIDDDGER